MMTLDVIYPDMVRDVLSKVAAHVRTVPSLIMLITSFKGFIGFLINIFIFVGVMIAGWKMVEKNEREENLTSRDFDGLAKNNPVFDYSRQTLNGVNQGASGSGE